MQANNEIKKSFIQLSSNESRYKLSIFGLKFSFRKKFNNKIYLIKNNKRKLVKHIKGISIEFKGSNNIVEVQANKKSRFKDCKFVLKENNKITIKPTQYPITNLSIAMRYSSNAECKIGTNFSSTDCTIITNSNTSITIGDDCMFSDSSIIRSGDSHTIYDINTKQILNYSENITIGDHVWLGNGARVLKGVQIPNNFVVGTLSLVTQSSTKNIEQSEGGGILAGIPAKLIKTNINWDRLCISDYINKQKI